MVKGKITTKFIPLPGRVLYFSIDGTGETSAGFTVPPILKFQQIDILPPKFAPYIFA
jgi:hypothetical protein